MKISGYEIEEMGRSYLSRIQKIFIGGGRRGDEEKEKEEEEK